MALTGVLPASESLQDELHSGEDGKHGRRREQIDVVVARKVRGEFAAKTFRGHGVRVVTPSDELVYDAFEIVGTLVREMGVERRARESGLLADLLDSHVVEPNSLDLP
jgi:hypothetical protein